MLADSIGQESQENSAQDEGCKGHQGIDGYFGCMRQEQFCRYRVVQDVQRGKLPISGQLVLIKVILRHEIPGRSAHSRGRSVYRFRQDSYKCQPGREESLLQSSQQELRIKCSLFIRRSFFWLLPVRLPFLATNLS